MGVWCSMDPNLRAAVLGASNIQAPASSLGASAAPELAKLYAINFQAPQSSLAVKAQAQNASTAVQAQEEAAKIAAQKQQDLGDFKAYKIVKKNDGGYDFFDPTGQQVDIATLSQRTGANPADVLKDSQNPIDIQYVNDYQNLQKLGNALLNGDKATVQAYTDADKSLKKYATTRGGYQQLVNDFQKYYQRYYLTRSVSPTAWGISPADHPFVPTPQSANSVGTPSL